MQNISPTDLAAWLADAERPAPFLLDVREPGEVAIGIIPGSETIPMHHITGNLDRIPQDRPVVCICHHGGRSAQVAYFLESRGYSQVLNLSSGVDGWAVQVDPHFPRY